jgi:hypothetical protein
MAARRRTVFPGVSQDATKELIGLQDDQQRESAALRQEAIGSTTDTKTASGYAAKFNETVRVLFPAGGGSVVFPAAAVGSVNRWIEVIVLAGSGPVKIVPESKQVDGAANVTLTTAGRYAWKSDGLASWWRLSGSSGGGGGGGGENLAATLALGNATGANNVQVDVAQHVNFGLAGPATSNPQIRSGDATFRIRGAGNVFVISDSGLAGMASTSATGTALVQAQGASGVAQMDSANLLALSTGGISRVVIASTGEWTTPAGSSGQVLTHQGPGVPPIWAAAGGGGGTDPRIFAWFGV